MTQPPGYGPPPGRPAVPGGPPQPIGAVYPGYPPPGYPPPGYPPPGYWPAPPPPPVSPGGVPLADFLSRLAAHLIDGAIVGFGSAIIFVPVFLVVFWNLPNPDTYADTAPFREVFTGFFLPLLLVEAGFFVFLMVVYYVYFVEYMHRKGETIGKKVMKIRVVPIDPSARLTRGMAVKRYLVQFLAGIVVPFFSYLDGLWQLWDKPYQQTLHDKAARTVVVKVFP